jgi:hypothetical protein
MNFTAPLPRTSLLLAFTSALLLITMKSSLIIWLNDLPMNVFISALIDLLQWMPDFGIGEVFETLRQRFLDWLRA